MSAWWQINLSDNEIFYGHIRGITASDLDLIDVAYVRSGSAARPVSLVSTQIQCPTNEIVINRDVITGKTIIQGDSKLVSELDNLASKPQLCFKPSP